MLTWELVGAVVGAGLASGREIASFFSRYGHWSIAGIVLSIMTMLFLSDAELPQIWRSSWQEALWKLLLSMLLIATGGAMLSGAGHVAALMLPIRFAYGWGIALTLLLAWLLAHRTKAGLAWVSRGMLCVLLLMIALGFFLPPMEAVHLREADVLSALVRGITYGGFNAALQTPIMAGAGYRLETRKKSAMGAAGSLFVLLMLGNGVLLRHPALLSVEMPFIRLMEEMGRTGYILGASCMYLAILSTLTACLRGLGRRMVPVFCVGAVSLLGFTGVVEWAYPILGGGCFMMLVAAKFTNCARRTFISRRDML